MTRADPNLPILTPTHPAPESFSTASAALAHPPSG